MSVTRSQCDAKPTVTFPAASRHRPVPTGLYQIILLCDRGTCVSTTCSMMYSTVGGQYSNLQPLDLKSSVLTTRPLSHTMVG